MTDALFDTQPYALAPVADDVEFKTYAEWVAYAWPYYVAAAATGHTFTVFDIAKKHKLKEPPDYHNWGHLTQRLRGHHLIEPVAADNSRRGTSRNSLVATWRGVPDTNLGSVA